MTSAQIRQSFLDFFASKQHTIVPSASLHADSRPNLLFTNAGMNQFVPYLPRRPEPSAPCDPPRAADTQKCIRAGGKHNDLEDVGLDTYHHTFFEMLGNWSFGDYFKKEAIDWAWELLVERLEASRRSASTPPSTSPTSPRATPPSVDQEACDIWAEIFRAAGLDPAVHIVNGNKKDNFWMMGDTGPCGPCSEIHVDLTPDGDDADGRQLVNGGDAALHRDLEPRLHPVQRQRRRHLRPAPRQARRHRHGLRARRSHHPGHQGLHRLRDAKISNYDTDVFRPIFDEIDEAQRQELRAAPCPRPARTGHHRAGEDRRRLPRHRRPHPHAQLRHRRRHPCPATTTATTSSAASCAAPSATAARSASPGQALLLQAGRRARRRRWATSSPRSARTASTCEDIAEQEEEAFNKTLDGNRGLSKRIPFDARGLTGSLEVAKSEADFGVTTHSHEPVADALSSSTTPSASRIDLTAAALAASADSTVDMAGFERCMEEEAAKTLPAPAAEATSPRSSRALEIATEAVTEFSASSTDDIRSRPCSKCHRRGRPRVDHHRQDRLLRRDGRPGR